MITVRLQIGDGSIKDTQEHGLVYISSDTRFNAPLKEFESTSYPEEAGIHILPKTTFDAFDYTVRFFIQATSLNSANAIIKAFNAKLYSGASDIKTFNRVRFYNDYKDVLIVGYPEPIAEATDFWRDSAGKALDVVCVDWLIHVDNPKDCNFHLSAENTIAQPEPEPPTIDDGTIILEPVINDTED